MVVLRLLLGLTEAGLFPGAVYTISQWYTRCRLLDQFHRAISHVFQMTSISDTPPSTLSVCPAPPSPAC